MDPTQMQVGLVGIGLLGSAIADRLLQRGISVTGFDVNSAQRRTFADQGGVAAATAEDVFERCPVVILSLPTSDDVERLLKDCLTARAKTTIMIDTTTSRPSQVLGIASRLQASGVQYVEANVAGSSEQLRRAEASLFVGVEADAIETARPWLDSLASRWFHLGPVGSASRFKLIHNLALGLHRAVMAEALVLGEAMGFDSLRSLEILRQTPAASAVMEVKGDKMATGDYRPQARLSQHLKDVRLILESAQQLKTPVPLSATHCELLELAERAGFGDADNSAIIEAYRELQSQASR